MKAKTAADPDKTMNSVERTFQKETLFKYRTQNIIPSLQAMQTKTASGMNTCVSFMNGNTTHEKIQVYIRLVLEKNLRPLPEDVKQLFAIWDRVKKV